MNIKKLIHYAVYTCHTVLNYSGRRTILLFALAISTIPLRPTSAQENAFLENTSQSTQCSIPLPERNSQPWTKQEKWVWNERLCLGKQADLRLLPEGANHACNKTKISELPNNHTLTLDFMRTILFLSPHRDHENQIGIQISCARFPDLLDLSFGNYKRAFRITKSYFAKGIDANKARLERDFSIEGSVLDAPFEGFGLRVGGDLNISGTSIPTVNLRGARIDGFLFANNAIFKGHFRADGIRVGANLFFRAGHLNRVTLVGAKVAGDFDATDAVATGPLEADRIEVGGNVFLNGEESIARFDEPVNVSGAKIGGEFNAVNACFKASLEAYGMTLSSNFIIGLMDDHVINIRDCVIPAVTSWGIVITPSLAILGRLGLERAKIGGDLIGRQIKLTESFSVDNSEIGGDLFLGKQSVFHKVYIRNSVVDGNLDLSDNTFLEKVDLSSSQIVETLRLSGFGMFSIWGDNSRLILRNLSVDTFRYREDALRNLVGRVDLVGFRYNQVRGTTSWENTQDGDRHADHRLAWLLNTWIGGQINKDKVFQPQPYQQLATSLRGSGYHAHADQVAVAMRNQERTHDSTTCFRKGLLTASWVLLGYGYRVWQLAFWFGGIILLGVFVFHFDRSGKNLSFWRKLFFSLEVAVPLIPLTALHENTARELDYGANWYFVCHKIMGLIIVSVLVASLAGVIS